MISDSELKGLKEGKAEAIASIEEKLERRTLTHADIIRVWEAVLEGVQNGGNVRALVNFGANKLSTASQDPEIGRMYENLLSLQAFPAADVAYAPTISIGAALARMSQGEVPARLDKNTYLRLAKTCLLNAVAKGNEHTRKYAAEALRYIDDKDVKTELIRLAKTSGVDALKEAAGDSVGFMRTNSERYEAHEDKAALIMMYPDPTSLQRMYIECIFSTVETVLANKQATQAEMSELEVAVKQLASFGAESGKMMNLFTKASLELIQINVENALLHALTNSHSKDIKMEAAAGLEKIASDRVEKILECIVERMGEGTETGSIASDALAGIRGKKVEILEVTLPPPFPPRSSKQKPQPPLQKPVRIRQGLPSDIQ